MELVFDIGNSDITIGVYHKGRWEKIWRVPSGGRNELHYGIQIRDLFLEADIDPNEIQSAVLSSVVPDLTEIITTVSNTLFPVTTLVLNASIYQRLPIKVLNPYQIGSDLVANAVAAFTKYNNACVIIDFGTALTYTVVDERGTIAGVAIAPGLKTSLKALSQNTAKLFDVPLEMPSSVLGKGTVHAIQAGLLISTEGAVKHMTERIQAELGRSIRKIATGGLCGVIPSVPLMVDEVEPNLTLEGLLKIGRISAAS